MASIIALEKTTPDGNFTVRLTSDGFSPERDHEEIPGESLYQLVLVLEELAAGIRLMVDPDLQRNTPLSIKGA
jgi:hypothetical protein